MKSGLFQPLKHPLFAGKNRDSGRLLSTSTILFFKRFLRFLYAQPARFFKKTSAIADAHFPAARPTITMSYDN